MTQSIKQLAQHLRTHPQAKLIFMVGAGISTAAGIPDFRSPETGLYNNLQRLDLPYAEAVFDIDFFKENPRPFYLLAKELFPGLFKPTRFHYLMKLMDLKGKLQRVYTQNIDTLERIAGVDDAKLVEAHGSFAKCSCVECSEEYDYEEFFEKVQQFGQDDGGRDELIHCKKCKKGLVKPGIVFFGEGLPSRFFDLWDQDLTELAKADEGNYVTITAGTSLTVYPFASLPAEVPAEHVRVLVNKDLVGPFREKRKGDYVFLESSDEFCDEFVKEMGWEDEFTGLIEGHVGKADEGAQASVEKSTEIANEIEEELAKEEQETEEQDLESLKDVVAAIQDLKVSSPSPPPI